MYHPNRILVIFSRNFVQYDVYVKKLKLLKVNYCIWSFYFILKTFDHFCNTNLVITMILAPKIEENWFMSIFVSSFCINLRQIFVECMNDRMMTTNKFLIAKKFQTFILTNSFLCVLTCMYFTDIITQSISIPFWWMIMVDADFWLMKLLFIVMYLGCHNFCLIECV